MTGNGFNRLYGWLEDRDFLVIRADRKPCSSSSRSTSPSRSSRWRNARKEPSAMKIIGADERLAEKRGAKILIVGPTGVGKTSLLRTLDPDVDVVPRRRGRRSVRAGRAGRYDPHRRLGAWHATSPAGSAAPTRASRRPRLLPGALRGSRRRARKSRAATRRSSSTASPKSRGSRSVTPSSSRKRPPPHRHEGPARRLRIARACRC